MESTKNLFEIVLTTLACPFVLPFVLENHKEECN